MNKLTKSIAVSLFVFFVSIFFLLSGVVFAQDQENTPSASPQSVDSYTLFWPLYAGKTESDSLYSLKLFKEKVQGWFIFGENKKADYAVMLGTKRTLEAEKLIKDNKTELAQKTLKNASAHYAEAYDYIKVAASKDKFSAKEIRRDRLINVKTLINSLKISALQEEKGQLEGVEGKVNALLADYLP